MNNLPLMLTITEYKKRHIDRLGRADALLLNMQGEGLYLGDVTSVTNSNGRLKARWRATDVPLQWHAYKYIALLDEQDDVVFLQEITPIHFDGKPSNVEIVFHE